MSTSYLATSQPTKLIETLKKQAKKNGKTLSAYVGELLVAGLPDDLKNKIPERRKPGRITVRSKR